MQGSAEDSAVITQGEVDALHVELAKCDKENLENLENVCFFLSSIFSISHNSIESNRHTLLNYLFHNTSNFISTESTSWRSPRRGVQKSEEVRRTEYKLTS